MLEAVEYKNTNKILSLKEIFSELISIVLTNHFSMEILNDKYQNNNKLI